MDKYCGRCGGYLGSYSSYGTGASVSHSKDLCDEHLVGRIERLEAIVGKLSGIELDPSDLSFNEVDKDGGE